MQDNIAIIHSSILIYDTMMPWMKCNKLPIT